MNNALARGLLAGLMLTLPQLAHAGGCYPTSYPVRTNYVYPPAKVYQATKFQAVPQTIYNYTINNNQAAAQQGTSLYGISQIDPFTVTPDLQLQLSAATADRLTASATSISTTALATHAQAVAAHASVTESVAKVAALQAYNAGAAAAVANVENQHGVNVTVTQQGGEPAAQGDASLQSVQQKCASCHSAENAAAKGKGHLLSEMSNAAIFDAVVIKRTMPKGSQLSEDELRAIAAATR